MRKKKQNDASTISVVLGDSLPTSGFCWVLTTRGKFCFEKNSFQSISLMGDELFYEEFLDGKKYSYKMQNTKKIEDKFSSQVPNIGNRKLAHAMSDTSWLEANDGVKYGCKVENLKGFHFDSDDNHILDTNGDGSSVWSFGDWVITVDPKMVPISFRSNHGDQLIANVQGLEKFSSSMIGCDSNKEGNDSPEISSQVHERYLKILDAHDPSISEEKYFSTEGTTRRLDWVTDLQGSISNTQWCGAGTDVKKTPCPDKAKSFDFYADQACRRHDHGAKYESTLIGLPRLECYVDKQLIDEGGHNWAVSAAYGKWGGMGVIGCYNYESYNCWYWKGWSLRYGHCGYEWDINYGYWRYDNAWKKVGYRSQPQSCPYDYLLDW